jgi:hypothetical protein
LRSGTHILSCAPYSSSRGGQVGNHLFCHLPLFSLSVPMFSDTHGEGAGPCRSVSDVYAYDQATPQSVWRAETGRQAQDALTRTLRRAYELIKLAWGSNASDQFYATSCFQ